MAEKRVIELEVKENFKKVEKDIDSLNQSLKETADTTRDVNKTFSDVYGELQPLTSRMGEAEDRLYELAAAGETASKEYKDLLKTVADYRKVQINTDIVVDAASSTMSTKMTNAIGGVANAFSVAEGASALMGVESEKLQETMVKLQAAMAISQGIQGLKEGGLAFKQMGASAMNALKGIKTGLAATGIGLFVVALGAIVVYWDDIKAAVSGVSSEQAKLNELSHANFETSKEQLSNLDAQDNVLKLQGKSEREILNLKIAKVNTAIELGKIELKNVLATSKAEEAAAIQNYNMTKKIVDFVLDIALYVPKLMTVPIDLAIAGANKISEALGFGKVIALDMGKTLEGLKDKASAFVAGSIFDVPELKKENALAAKEIEKSLKDLENQQAGFKLSIKEMDKAAIEQSKETATTEIDVNKEKNEELIRLETKSVTDIQALKLNGDLNQLKNQKAINTIKLDAYSEYLESVKKKEEEEIEAQKQAQEKRVDLILKYAQTFSQAMSSLNGLLNANDEERLKNVKKGSKEEEAIKRKMFDRDKKLRIVQTVIDTASNVVTSVRNGGGVPAGIPFGVAAAAMGVMQIAAISKTKFEGGGEQVQSPSDSGGAMAPNFNVIGSSGVNQLAQIQQQPTRAYVVSGDVATGLSLERNRLQNASF